MNAKLNNHIGQQNEYKAYLNERLDKLDALTLNREIEKIPTKYEMLQMDQTLKRIIADVESIRNDQLTQKELDLIKQEEADAFFKKTANDYFNKLREMDDQLKRGICYSHLICSDRGENHLEGRIEAVHPRARGH